MKTYYRALLCLLLLAVGGGGYAQKIPQKDTTVTLRVEGNCEQCKDRIEKAARGRGVKKAVWDIGSKMLLLVYNPAFTTQDKVENRIVQAGHDIANKKAPVITYNNLPACCHYRTGPMNNVSHTLSPTPPVTDSGSSRKDSAQKNAAPTASATAFTIKGVVLEANRKGDFTPLPGASISWLGTTEGVSSGASGIFEIRSSAAGNRLVVSYAGYQADTITVNDPAELKVILAANQRLSEVTVTAKIRSTYVSGISPVRTQVMTDKELFKAACCNLSESFETNPSVDVSYSDAVTGSKQIQLLGLSGNYTQLTVENLPGPRGIATPLGLNAIAGPWVESIQLTKGIGSVANGFESIAGQINVELKKPETAEQLYANAYINDFGKTDINLNLAHKINRHWSVALLSHGDFLSNKSLDQNKDGFRDLPTGYQGNLIGRMKYDNGKGVLLQVGVKYYEDRRIGGETAYNEATDKNTTRHYGLSIDADRYEVFAKLGYVFPQKKYKSIGWQLDWLQHDQRAYFGLTTYNANEKNFYSNLLYQSIIGNTNHKFRTGFSLVYDRYDEDFRLTNYRRNEVVPGAFFEYTFTQGTRFNLVAGIRADHNNLSGFFVTPRLHIRYEPRSGTTIRIGAGRGQRTANIFAENNSVLVSARQVNIIGQQPGKAYGLEPEVAWNEGITIDQHFKLAGNDANLSLDFFRTDFVQQVVVDMEDPRKVDFYNLSGQSFSNSFQAELNAEPLHNFNTRLAYRFFDVRTTYHGRLLERPLVAAHRAFLNLAYSFRQWKFDYTVSYTGTRRIPSTAANPVVYQRPERSPSFVLMNAQVSRSIGQKRPVDIYLGCENISNYFQKQVIIAADQPFGPYFDAALVYGPVTGRMFYAGMRFKIK